MYNRLKQLREHLGLTQDEIADKLGMSRSNWSLYERGKHVPNARVLRTFQSELGVNLEWLNEGVGEMMLQHHQPVEISRDKSRLDRPARISESGLDKLIDTLTAEIHFLRHQNQVLVEQLGKPYGNARATGGRFNVRRLPVRLPVSRVA